MVTGTQEDVLEKYALVLAQLGELMLLNQRGLCLSDDDVSRNIQVSMGMPSFLYTFWAIVCLVRNGRLIDQLVDEPQHKHCECSIAFTIVMETPAAVSNK